LLALFVLLFARYSRARRTIARARWSPTRCAIAATKTVSARASLPNEFDVAPRRKRCGKGAAAHCAELRCGPRRRRQLELEGPDFRAPDLRMQTRKPTGVSFHGKKFKPSCRPDSVQKQALRRERRRAFSLTREEILFSLLLRLRIEKVVHHRDDDGHALHQRDVCRVGQYGQSRF
jgi:hypothetical protein